MEAGALDLVAGAKESADRCSAGFVVGSLSGVAFKYGFRIYP